MVPRPYRKETGVADPKTGDQQKEVKEGIFFATGYVFDVAQTDGTPLPAAPDWKTSGDGGVELAGRLERYAAQLNINVSTEAIAGGAQGVSKGGAIVLTEGLSPLGQAQVLAHELAHERLHQRAGAERPDRATRELEAEAVAYVVCAHFGFGDQLNSPNYLALWDADSQKLAARMDRISATAREMIEAIEGEETHDSTSLD